MLSNRARGFSRSSRALNLVAGMALCVLATPLLPFTTRRASGAVLIVAARRTT
jgi:hypothetical protein